MNSIAFPAWPTFDADEKEAVDAVLSSGRVNYWTGEQGREFEREYARVLGLRRSIALMNGTVALELALRAWHIGPGDEVVVTPRSFIASTSCAVLLGVTPVFADVDRESGNLTAESIERVLSPRTKAIIPVHVGGWPCEMEDIVSLADARGIKVVEDCAQANGATVRGRPVGSIGHAGAFSFCQDKIITTGGEGGLLATDEEDLWSQAWSFKDHGKSYEAVYERDHAPGFRWLHESFGTNYRMTELQSAIGRSQLRKLEAWSERRRANAQTLIDRLGSVPALRVPVPAYPYPARVLSLLRVREAGAPPQWLEPRSRHFRSERKRRSMFLGLVLGDLPRAGISRHGMGAFNRPEECQGVGGNKHCAPRPSDPGLPAHVADRRRREWRPGPGRALKDLPRTACPGTEVRTRGRIPRLAHSKAQSHAGPRNRVNFAAQGSDATDNGPNIQRIYR